MHAQLQISLAQRSDKGFKEHNEDFYDTFLPEASMLDSKHIACAIADEMNYCANAQEANEVSNELTHPNATFIKHSAPLPESNIICLMIFSS